MTKKFAIAFSGILAVWIIVQVIGESLTPSAELYPSTLEVQNQLCNASNALDGHSNIGESGPDGVINCASTSHPLSNQLQYLQIDLHLQYAIAAVRLHLRDGEVRRKRQRGLVVMVSNNTIGKGGGKECGVYVSKKEQSPLFSCWTTARYVYAVLRSEKYPLQVCEMQIFKAMNLTAPGIATIFPNNVYTSYGKKAVAGNAVDGLSNIGDSGAHGAQNCAGLQKMWKWYQIEVQYLHVDLGHTQQIYAIRLHLRDGENDFYQRYKDQAGMVIKLSNSSDISISGSSCGSPYNPAVGGQSPVFVCDLKFASRYVWMIVRNSKRPLFICEVEIYADAQCQLPPNPPDGRYIVTRLSHGGSLSVACDKGFRTETPEPVTCEMSGSWSRKLPTCNAFTCSSCHKDSDCVEASYCRCKKGYVGNGTFCCPKDMGGAILVAGSTVMFRCDRVCNIPFQRVTWSKNGSALSHSQSRYGFLHKGNILYVEDVSATDKGLFTCEMHVGGATYTRYGALEVISVSRRKDPSTTMCSLDCGIRCVSPPKPRVSSDIRAYPGEFPWQAMLCFPSQRLICGGVLVSPDCVVTAAHCARSFDIDPRNISVCLGRHCGSCSEKDPLGSPQCFKPKSYEVHPQYDSGTLVNDILVMKIERPLKLNCTSVYPVCLPEKERDSLYIKRGAQGIVTGWGEVKKTSGPSTCLRRGRADFVSRRKCTEEHIKYTITKDMICATDKDGACDGDSGGPLVVKNKHFGNRYVLAGIVSWGVGCGRSDGHGVYTSALSHLNWIKKACGIRNE